MKQSLQILLVLGFLVLVSQISGGLLKDTDRLFVIGLGSSFFAFIITIIAFNLSLQPRNRLVPYIGAAFLASGMVDLLVALYSKSIFVSPSSAVDVFYCWSWCFGHSLFGAIILFGLIRIGKNAGNFPSVVLLYGLTALLAAGAIPALSLLPLPSPALSEFSWLRRPIEWIPQIFYIACIAWTFKIAGRPHAGRETHLAKMLFPALGLIILAQGVKAGSEQIISDELIAANGIKLISYIAALVPLTMLLKRYAKYSIEIAETRVVLVFSSVFLAFLLISVTEFTSSEANLELVELEGLVDSTESFNRVNIMHQSLVKYLETRDEKYRDVFQKHWEEEVKFQQQLADSGYPEQKQKLNDSLRDLHKIVDNISTGAPRSENGSLQVAQNIATGINNLLLQLTTIAETQGEVLEAHSQQAAEEIHQYLTLVIGAFVFLLPLMIGLHIWHTRAAVKPLLRLTDISRRIIAGEKNVKIVNDQKNEIGVLAGSFSVVLERLQNAIGGLEERVEERTEALRRSAQQLQNIMDNAGEAIITTNGWGVIEMANPATSRIFGFGQDELLGRPFYNLISEEHRDGVIFNIMRIRKSNSAAPKREYCRRLSGLRKDGSMFSLEMNISEVSDEEGAIFILVIRDITETLNAENMLRLSEQRMSRFFDASMEGLLFHEKGKIIDANNAFLQLAGGNIQDFVGKNLVDFVIPECRQEMLKKINSHYPEPWESVMVCNERSRLPVEIQMRDINFSENITSIAVVRDVSERKKAKSAIRRQNEFTQRILDTISSLVFVLNPEGKIIRFNRACQQTTGFTLEDVEGKHIWNVMIDMDDESDIQHVYEHPVPENFPSHRQYQWLTKDGDIKVIDWVNTAAISGDGTVEYVIATGADITDRLQVEKELAAERRNLERKVKERTRELDTIFNLSPDGFVMINKDSDVVYVNPAFQEMTGMNPNEVIGLSETEFYMRLSGLSDTEKDNDAAGFNWGADTEVLCLHYPVKRYLICNSRILWDEISNTRGGRVLYFRDVTHETEVDRMKSEFLSIAAHEFRTPLSSILGFSELLLSSDFNDKKRRNVTEIIHRQSVNLKTLLDELLDLARIDARAGKDFRIIIDTPEKLVKQVCEETMSLSQENHRLRLEPPDHWPLMAFDQDKLRQVLVNVISNAYKYSPGGGEVSCSTLLRDHGQKQQFGIKIQDQGLGMSPEELRHVGERFFRADSVNAIGGTGLGMSLVKEIIEIFEGEVEIESEKGKGTTVILWLPIVDPIATARAM